MSYKTKYKVWYFPILMLSILYNCIVMVNDLLTIKLILSC